MAVYQPTIPQPTDKLNASQKDIQDNFTVLDASFGVDHTAYSVSSNVGFHKKITIQDSLLADPNQVAPISSFYTKGTPSQLFFQNGALASDVVQLTGSLPNETGNDGFGGGYTLFFLPWALKLFMGSTVAASGSTNYTLSGTTGFGSLIYTSQCTPFGGGFVSLTFSPSGGTKNFNITRSASIPTRWMVITN